jgi:hypothetical protein
MVLFAVLPMSSRLIEDAPGANILRLSDLLPTISTPTDSILPAAAIDDASNTSAKAIPALLTVSTSRNS